MTNPCETVRCDACCGWRPRWQFHDCQPQLKQAREENSKLRAALDVAKEALDAIGNSHRRDYVWDSVQAINALSKINEIMGGEK